MLRFQTSKLCVSAKSCVRHFIVITGCLSALLFAGSSTADPRARSPVTAGAYFKLVRARFDRHTYAEFSQFIEAAERQSSGDQLDRLYFGYSQLILMNQKAEADTVKARLRELAVKAGAKRYLDLLAIDEVSIRWGDDPITVAQKVQILDAESSDPIVKAHAKNVAAQAFGELKQSQDALRALTEARALLKPDAPIGRLMLNENWGTTGYAYLRCDDVEDAISAMIEQETTYSNPYPDLDYSSLDNLNWTAVVLGDEAIARQTAEAIRDFSSRLPTPSFGPAWQTNCANVADAFGAPNAVLECLRERRFTKDLDPFWLMKTSVWKGVALTKLGRVDEARREYARATGPETTGLDAIYHAEDARLHARLLAHDGRVDEALDMLETYWRDARQTDAQNYRTSIGQLTRDLRRDLVSLRMSDELNRRVIELQWVLAAAGAFAIATILWGFMEQRRLNARLDQARSSAVEARQEAERANAIKNQFLANMSHEIRTPLNGMMGMLQALQFGRLDPDQKAQLDVLHASSQGVLSILNDLLDISKIEAGKLSLESAPFDPAASVEELVAVYRPAAEAKGLSLELNISPDVRGGRLGDALRWRQILGNLLSNAVKFTKVGGVVVSLTGEGEQLDLVISDTGLGLTEEHLARVFNKFEQADPSTTRRFGGTGLGLAITRELILAMGGAISVDSSMGVGSSFHVTLPLPHLAETDALPAIGSASSVKDVVFNADLPGRLRILAAEDHEVNQLVLVTLLKSLDCEVVMVSDGAQAIAAFETGVWDVVLLDIQMPNVDGYAAVREIRAVEARRGLSRTPVVAVTANVMVHQVGGYRAAGFDGELGKPIALDALIEMLSRVVGAADPLTERQTPDVRNG